MALKMENATRSITFGIWESIADEEVHSWPLMKNFNEALTVIIVYLLMVLALGPAYMKNKKPYNLRTPILWYNAAQVLFSAWLVYIAIAAGIPFSDYFSTVCHHKTNTSRAHRLAVSSVIWWYVVAKITEMIDTMFFVLRKKYNQVSFLHVYHHFTTFLFAWFLLKVGPEEQSLLLIAINSFIHVFMYSYYALAALGPQYQKYLWWKKHMTAMQIMQFLLDLGYLICAKFSNCNYSNVITNMLITNTVFLILLFTNFYVSSYNKKKES